VAASFFSRCLSRVCLRLFGVPPKENQQKTGNCSRRLVAIETANVSIFIGGEPQIYLSTPAAIAKCKKKCRQAKIKLKP